MVRLEGSELEAQLNAILWAAGFSNQDLQCTLENYDPDYGGNGPALEACRRFAAEFWSGSGAGLMLHGPVGVGKSHLAAGTVRALVARIWPREISVRKWKLPEILVLGRSLFDDSSEFAAILERISGLDLVWLDEFNLDVVGPGGFERTRAVETLYRFVDAIVEEHVGWIVTTNYTPTALFRHLSQLEPMGRIVDRMRAVLVPVAVRGESYRPRKREKCLPDWLKGGVHDQVGGDVR